MVETLLVVALHYFLPLLVELLGAQAVGVGVWVRLGWEQLRGRAMMGEPGGEMNG